jgi:uncharacterized protein (DUF2384 family)
MKANSLSLQRHAEVRVFAIETFGSKATADAWLNHENFVLGATPISLVDSDTGFLEVKRALGAICYGGVIKVNTTY